MDHPSCRHWSTRIRSLTYLTARSSGSGAQQRMGNETGSCDVLGFKPAQCGVSSVRHSRKSGMITANQTLILN